MATVDLPRAAAKTWVRFNGTGTVAINDSENVTSITDHGAGDYTVNIAQDYAAANYCWVGGARQAGANAFVSGSPTVAAAAGSHRIRTVDPTGSPIDSSEVCVAYFGDLA